jgi:putative 3-demethylubiquinone-9 3-methyltransferase
VSYGVQPQAKKPSPLPKVLTIICSVLAVIFLLVSATMFVSARSKAQEIEDARADIQSADAKTVQIDSEITSTKEQITAAKAKKDAQQDAQQWCTDFNKDSMKVTDLDKMASTLKTMPELQRNAVGEVCAGKKAFAEAFAKDLKRGMVNTGTPTCDADGKTVTIYGTVSLDAPNMAKIGSIDITYDVYAADHEITDSDTPLGTTTATVPSGGTGNYSATVPFAASGTFNCAVRVKSIWPTGL